MDLKTKLVEEMNKHLADKRNRKKYHEARFSGFSPTGRIRVVYNAAYPYGVAWTHVVLNRENVPESVKIPEVSF